MAVYLILDKNPMKILFYCLIFVCLFISKGSVLEFSYQVCFVYFPIITVFLKYCFWFFNFKWKVDLFSFLLFQQFKYPRLRILRALECSANIDTKAVHCNMLQTIDNSVLICCKRNVKRIFKYLNVGCFFFQFCCL